MTENYRERPAAGTTPLVPDEALEAVMERVRAEGAELLGADGLLTQLTKAVLERALAEELTDHLGYEKGDPAGAGSGNSRNGATPKRVHTDVGTGPSGHEKRDVAVPTRRCDARRAAPASTRTPSRVPPAPRRRLRGGPRRRRRGTDIAAWTWTLPGTATAPLSLGSCPREHRAWKGSTTRSSPFVESINV